MNKLSPMVVLAWALVCALQNVGGQSDGSRTQKPTNSKQPLNGSPQDFLTELGTLKGRGRGAFGNEMAREKAGDCTGAVSTYDMVSCLGKEIEKTTANYKTYVGALRSIEELDIPGGANDGKMRAKALPVDERIRSFDRAEAAWQSYQKAQCTAAYDAYKGGTIAPVMEITCHLQLMRDRMRELESIYQLMH